MKPEDDWSADLTRHIAKQIRNWRKELGLSARQVAERCAELGYEIPRDMIADLENGRRRSISVAELLVLARALGVPPVDLVFPLEASEHVRISPAENLTSLDAARWFGGADSGQPVRGDAVKRVLAAMLGPSAGRLAKLQKMLEEQAEDLLQAQRVVNWIIDEPVKAALAEGAALATERAKAQKQERLHEEQLRHARFIEAYGKTQDPVEQGEILREYTRSTHRSPVDFKSVARADELIEQLEQFDPRP